MKILAVFVLGCVCFGAMIQPQSVALAGAFVNGGSSLPDGVNAPDLFQSAAVKLGAPPPMTKHTFMEQIEAIEEKLRTNLPLCVDEIKTWNGVRMEMMNSLGTDYCTEFQTSTGEDALCCYIQASGTNYGLCSFLSIVNKSESVTSNTPVCPPDSPFTSNNTGISGGTGLISSRQVIHVDLFGEICTDVDILNLCYVYVSSKTPFVKFRVNTNLFYPVLL